MKKEDLRKIEYGSYNPKKAYFHHWLIKKDIEGGEYTMALIELEDGSLKEDYPSEIKFIDEE